MTNRRPGRTDMTVGRSIDERDRVTVVGHVRSLDEDDVVDVTEDLPLELRHHQRVVVGEEGAEFVERHGGAGEETLHLAAAVGLEQHELLGSLHPFRHHFHAEFMRHLHLIETPILSQSPQFPTDSHRTHS